MSPRDPPLWARGAAVALVVVASWWLLSTATLRAVVGDSVAALGAGVVAAFVLRGMHLPLGLWPAGATRERFSAGWVIAAAVAFGALLVLGNPGTAPALLATLDRGTYALVIVGVVAWGLCVALVAQRRFAPWYGAAVAAGLAPWVVELVATRPTVCPVAFDGASVACPAGAFQAFTFTLAVTTSTGLITTELAFRRLVLGHMAGAGLVLTAGAAAAAVVWRAVVAADPITTPEGLWWLGTGLTAAALYALSGSLLVSATYSGTLAAGRAAVALGVVGSGEAMGGGAGTLVAHLAVAAVAGAVVWRRNGVTGGLRAARGAGAEVAAGRPGRSLEEAAASRGAAGGEGGR